MKALALLTILLTLALPFGLDAGDASAKIKRSTAARYQFIKVNPCPSTGQIKGACPGYVVDHIVPLKRGGADHPDNMQWQTREQAKEKDRWE